jgi:hypothetical protein
MMTKGEDDTTEDADQPQPPQPPKPEGYYYDDSTGYEIYEPTNELEEDEPEE